MKISAINNQTNPNFNAKFRFFECPTEKITKESKDILSKKTLDAFSNRISKLGNKDDNKKSSHKNRGVKKGKNKLKYIYVF